MGAQASTSEEARKTIVVVGVTGAGKSSTCNVLSGTSLFAESEGLASHTSEVDHCDCKRKGLPIRIVDTVGFLSNVGDMHDQHERFGSFSDFTPYGIDVFLLTEKYGRWTDANERHFNIFRELAGAEVLKHTILLFTHVTNKDLQKRLDGPDVPEGLRKVIQQVGAVCGVESKKGPRAAMADLSDCIVELVEANAGGRYSNRAITEASQRREALKAQVEALVTPHLKTLLQSKLRGLSNGNYTYKEVLKAVEAAEASEANPVQIPKADEPDCCAAGPMLLLSSQNTK